MMLIHRSNKSIPELIADVRELEWLWKEHPEYWQHELDIASAQLELALEDAREESEYHGSQDEYNDYRYDSRKDRDR